MPQQPSHIGSGPYGSSPYPQQHAQGGGQGGAGVLGGAFGAYGNFMGDPTAQFAAHFGQTAFKQGQDYVEQNVGSPPAYRRVCVR